VDYVRNGREPAYCKPNFAPEDYLGKYWCLLTEITRAGRLREGAVVFSPEVLGDNWEEIVQTLSLIAQTKGVLSVANPSPHSANPTPIEFVGLHEAIEQSRAQDVALRIKFPCVLGHDLGEILTSLSEIALGGASLVVLRPQPGAFSLQDLFF
jgi:hypothetical protein